MRKKHPFVGQKRPRASTLGISAALSSAKETNPRPKLKPRWDVHLLGVENQAGSRAGGLDCRMVRQRRFTSAFRTTSPARKWLTLSRTFALVQGTCSRWPPLSLSPDGLISVEVRAVARGFTSRSARPGVRRYSLTASPRRAGAFPQPSARQQPPPTVQAPPWPRPPAIASEGSEPARDCQ